MKKPTYTVTHNREHLISMSLTDEEAVWLRDLLAPRTQLWELYRALVAATSEIPTQASETDQAVTTDTAARPQVPPPGTRAWCVSLGKEVVIIDHHRDDNGNIILHYQIIGDHKPNIYQGPLKNYLPLQ